MNIFKHGKKEITIDRFFSLLDHAYVHTYIHAPSIRTRACVSPSASSTYLRTYLQVRYGLSVPGLPQGLRKVILDGAGAKNRTMTTYAVATLAKLKLDTEKWSPVRHS